MAFELKKIPEPAGQQTLTIFSELNSDSSIVLQRGFIASSLETRWLPGTKTVAPFSAVISSKQRIAVIVSAVNVSAKDKMTGLEQAMQITPSSGLAPDEIDLLIMEAETSIEKDREAKELILHRNRLDSLVKSTRRAMLEFGKSIPLNEQQEINRVLNEAEESDWDDSGEIQTHLVKVEAVANQLTESLMAAV